MIQDSKNRQPLFFPFIYDLDDQANDLFTHSTLICIPLPSPLSHASQAR